MIRVCAWCSRILGEVPPVESVERTHGICPECVERVRREDAFQAAAAVRPDQVVIIVQRCRRELYWHLRGAFEDCVAVEVICDRRQVADRRSYGGVEPDALDAGRRQTLTPSEQALWQSLGIRVIRLAGAPAA